MFGPCPKCHGVTVHVGYYANDKNYGCWHEHHPKREHFDIACQTCHYQWTEPVR